MLTQFALIVFAMCAVLSLIVDVGYARITQSQMQNAADAAALEGVRARDNGPVNVATGLPDGFASDCLRRGAVSRVVRNVFDDDLDPANGDPDYQFGAGPIIDLTDGSSNLHALQTMSVPDAHVYKPDLQLNQQNAVHGDMVSGSFSYSADPVSAEDLNYARNDFNPNPNSPQPLGGLLACPPLDQPPSAPTSTGSLTGAGDGAFLVRLRRSNELQGEPAQTEPDVASSGPSLPLVFGKGSMIYGDDATGTYSVRRDGLTVRATAIAQVRPALHVGLPQTNPAMPGVTSFALVDTFVQTLNANGCPATITVASGLIVTSAGGAGCPAAGATVGRFVANPSAISTVGQALPAPVAGACTARNGYGPVYSLMGSGGNRIIGFTRIGLSPNGAANATSCAAVIFRGVPLVAASNATAHLVGGLPLPVGAQPADVTELLGKNCPPTPVTSCRPGPGAVNYSPVLVPVLAR